MMCPAPLCGRSFEDARDGAATRGRPKIFCSSKCSHRANNWKRRGWTWKPGGSPKTREQVTKEILAGLGRSDDEEPCGPTEHAVYLPNMGPA